MNRSLPEGCKLPDEGGQPEWSRRIHAAEAKHDSLDDPHNIPGRNNPSFVPEAWEIEAIRKEREAHKAKLEWAEQQLQALYARK
jgi:hypothetical protein